MTVPRQDPRWLLLTEFFPPEFGGIQSALATIAEAHATGLVVMTKKQLGDQSFDANKKYQVIRRSLFSGRVWPRWSWLIGWLWRHRRDYQQTVFGHFSPAVTAAWILSWIGYRYAVLVHGQDILSEQRRGLRRWLVGPLLRRAAWVGVNSTFTGEIIHRYGVTWSRIVRTHPAVSDELLTLRAEPSGQRLITICRLVPRKNVELVIRAMQALRTDFPNLRYDVVGDGPDRSRLEDLTRELGLESIVTFYGWVVESEKLSLLAKARLAVMVPKQLEQGSDVEGLGIVYLEAAALGLPIIASRTGGIEDIVHDGETGLLVNPDSADELVQAIIRLLNNPEQARELGRAAQALVKAEFVASFRNHLFGWMLNPLWQSARPKVSIILPVYNHAQTIGRTLQSIINQTWQNYEIILVDDGSTDGLAQATQPWRDRLTLIAQPNQGAPVARNSGARQAKGEFLLFIDADTWLHPDMVTTMVQTIATHPSVAYTYSRFRFGPKGFRLHEFSVAKLRQQNYIHTSSLIRTKDFPGFDPDLRRFQDWDLWLTMADQGKLGLFIPLELFRVSQGRGGMKASRWLPRFVYRLPWIGQGGGSTSIRRYREFEKRIRAKHKLF